MGREGWGFGCLFFGFGFGYLGKFGRSFFCSFVGWVGRVLDRRFFFGVSLVSFSFGFLLEGRLIVANIKFTFFV